MFPSLTGTISMRVYWGFIGQVHCEIVIDGWFTSLTGTESEYLFGVVGQNDLLVWKWLCP